MFLQIQKAFKRIKEKTLKGLFWMLKYNKKDRKSYDRNQLIKQLWIALKNAFTNYVKLKTGQNSTKNECRNLSFSFQCKISFSGFSSGDSSPSEGSHIKVGAGRQQTPSRTKGRSAVPIVFVVIGFKDLDAR